MNDQRSQDPVLINRLYRNPRRGVVLGVCAGIAEYFGFDVNVVRIVVVIGLFFAGPFFFVAYILMGLLLPVRAYSDSGRPPSDPLERQVRSSPHDMLASVRYRFRDLDARLQRLEKYVTSGRYKLDTEFRKLEE